MTDKVRINPDYAVYCPSGRCYVIVFWNNDVTQGQCPCCGTLGDFIGGIETAPTGRPVEIELRENPVGRCGEREVDGGRRPLYEDVQLPERLRDNDSKEEGQS